MAERIRVPLPGGLLVNGELRTALDMRGLNGHEEERAGVYDGQTLAAKVSDLLAACVVVDGQPSPGLVDELLAGDRDALALALRRRTFGDRIHLVVTCPGEGHPIDVEFDTNDITIEQRRPAAAGHHVALPTRPCRFRLPNGADQAAVARLPRAQAVRALFARCVSDPDPATLSTEECTIIADAMEAAAPRVEIDLDLTCPECGAAFSEAFDPTDFFFRELARSSKFVALDVHEIASCYHWNEDVILALPRDRRRDYVRMIAAAGGAM